MAISLSSFVLKNMSLLVLSFFFLTFSYHPTMVQAAKKMCLRYFRPNQEECPQDFKSMCAFFSGSSCNSTTCLKLTANDCTACQDPTVLYYLDDACEGERIYCDTSMQPSECPSENNTVCAYSKENCSDESCRQTVIGRCNACQDSNTLFYSDGECPIPDDRIQCQPINFGNCSQTEPQPVCAFFTETCDKEICYLTVNNSCDACQDSSILYYKAGECAVASDQRKYCLPNNRPLACSDDINPVCGFSIQNMNDFQGLMYVNECTACQDTRINYYIPGQCVNSTEDSVNLENETINMEDPLEFLP